MEDRRKRHSQVQARLKHIVCAGLLMNKKTYFRIFIGLKERRKTKEIRLRALFLFPSLPHFLSFILSHLFGDRGSNQEVGKKDGKKEDHTK